MKSFGKKLISNPRENKHAQFSSEYQGPCNTDFSQIHPYNNFAPLQKASDGISQLGSFKFNGVAHFQK